MYLRLDGVAGLDRSIVDIYKVCDSLFEVKGVVEAVLTASVVDPETVT